LIFCDFCKPLIAHSVYTISSSLDILDLADLANVFANSIPQSVVNDASSFQVFISVVPNRRLLLLLHVINSSFSGGEKERGGRGKKEMRWHFGDVRHR